MRLIFPLRIPFAGTGLVLVGDQRQGEKAKAFTPRQKRRMKAFSGLPLKTVQGTGLILLFDGEAG
jgi:hypothetical protein